MKKTKGFTLIELVVVMAIIAVLALLVVGAIIAARRTATNTTNRGNAKTIQTAAEALYAKNKSYAALGTATQSFTTAKGVLDPIVGTITLAPSACDTVAAYAGGGRIVYAAGPPASWTITPVDYTCAAAGEMGGGDAPVLQ